MHCPGCMGYKMIGPYFASPMSDCPGVTCPQCEAKDAEIARLRAIQDQTANYMLERAEKYSQLVDEVIRLREQLGVARDAAVQAEQDYQRCREALKISDDARTQP